MKIDVDCPQCGYRSKCEGADGSAELTYSCPSCSFPLKALARTRTPDYVAAEPESEPEEFLTCNRCGALLEFDYIGNEIQSRCSARCLSRPAAVLTQPNEGEA
jgi:DNA-directed RNA polymerase subunit RPC12/RpoP